MSIRSTHSLRWSIAAGAIAASLALAPDAGADRWSRPRGERAAVGQLVSVEIRVDGHWVPLHRAPGVRDRQYFAAEHGANYALRIRNRSDRRVGVLVSVDGLNVVNGERSALSAHEPMYVLDARETTTIRGWRTSLDHVREFVFVDEERSYAERTGQANGDMGWVRVLAFEERRPVAWRAPRDRWRDRDDDRQRGKADRDDDPLAATPPPAPEGILQKGGEAPRTLEGESRQGQDSYPGTGWGDRRRDPVRETWFEPVAHARDHIVLRYEYDRVLAELGIYRDRDRLEDRERGEWRFAQPPSR